MENGNLILLLSILLCAIAIGSSTTPCSLKETKYGAVCVCNATYCDYLDDPVPSDDFEFVVVSSSKAGLRFQTQNGRFNLFRKFYIIDYDQQLKLEPQQKGSQRANTRQAHLNVDRKTQFQKIVGFGGSITGAVSHILNHLPQGLQDHIYESYYSQKGIGLNLMRITIGGCDFDLEPWAYNEVPEDEIILSNFTKLDPRDELRIGQIKRLKEVSKVKNLRIKGAAWSSPPWMKSNRRWTGRSRLLEKYYQTWADYHLRWLEIMEENDLPIWAISTGNEPTNGVAFWMFVKFMSLGWTPSQQAVWLNDYLGPTIRNSKFKDLIIFGNDDQRYTFPYWFRKMNSVRENSTDYLNGLAVHWYWDEVFSESFIEKAHAEMPDKIILVTESCIGDKPWQKAAPLLGSWSRGEKMARDVLQNLRYHCNGWIDWNIVLDEQGGPTYIDNTVDAPIVANMTNQIEVYKQPMFYMFGHFSKFIPEGSVRIESIRSNINIDSTAFLRPDGSIVVIAFNSGNANLELGLTDTERGSFVLNIPARSMHTIIYK